MMIHDITAQAGRWKNRKRVGRGEGSGHGKQSGRGNKGAKSRSGYARKLGHEGGQMPYFRRLPKMGFTNAPFKVRFWTVNLADIVAHPSFAKGGTVDTAALIGAGLVRDDSRDLKILGNMPKDAALKVKLNVVASRITGPAKKRITDAGGSIQETGTRRDRTRGIDLTTEDRIPKNWTKRLKRGGAPKAEAKPEGKSDAKPAKADKPAKAEKAAKPSGDKEASKE
ncbi:50S ribosomal protein L15 [Phycisphaerales bacterium]|nr:50S ribosomal protein L15 [Phycisphaerales bacterium]